MNHIQILKRSWKILWSYRTLWIFGILLALTTATGQDNISADADSWNRGARNFDFGPFEEFGRQMNELGEAFERVAPTDLSGWIGVGIAVLCLVLALIVLARIVNYLSRTALIRMVDKFELSGEKVNWRQGFRLGWSRAIWQLFLIDLMLYLPLVIVALVMLLAPAMPLIAAGVVGNEPSPLAVIAMIGFAFLTIFFLVVAGALLSIVIKFIRRECVLGDFGPVDSIRNGVKLVRANFLNVFLMWLIVLGLNISFVIVLIPFLLLFLGIGALLGGGVGWLAYTIFSAAGSETSALIAALVAGIFLFILVLATPLTFLDGLRETFLTTVWTLTYREVKPVEGLGLESPSELVLPDQADALLEAETPPEEDTPPETNEPAES